MWEYLEGRAEEGVVDTDHYPLFPLLCYFADFRNVGYCYLCVVSGEWCVVWHTLCVTSLSFRVLMAHVLSLMPVASCGLTLLPCVLPCSLTSCSLSFVNIYTSISIHAYTHINMHKYIRR